MGFGTAILIIIILVLLIILAAVLMYFLSKAKSQGTLTQALNLSLFLITLPKKQKKDADKTEKEKDIIAVMEQLYASLANLKARSNKHIYGQPYIVLEIATPETGEEIAFYIAIPKFYEDILEKQIHGIFPQASVEKVKDYNIFNPQGAAAAAYLKMERHFSLPFRTYQNLERDPLNEITNSLSKLAEIGEGAALQIIIKPSSGWQKSGLKIAKEMQKGASFEEARNKAGKGSASKIASDVYKDATKKSEKDKQSPESRPITPGQEEIIKALEGKSAKVGFETNIRLIVSAENQQRADQLLGHLESSFVQFNSPNLNSFKIVHVKNKQLKKLIYQYSFRMFNPQNSSILNTEELTSLYHFPQATIETPKVKFLKAEAAAPPANLPKEGVVLGHNNYRGVESVVRLQRNDRRRHLYIIGQTGTGKTVFMKNLIGQDILAGEGVCFMDPHGNDLESVMSLIPKERYEDVVLFDPSDTQRPLGLNMLDYDPRYPEQKMHAVNELMSIFDKLYDLKTTGGPMFEQYTRNALLLLMDDPNDKYTLMEVPRVMSDAEFRRSLLRKCQNIVVKDFWEKEAEKAGGETSLQNIVPYITSKFNVFVANDYTRPIIGQSRSSINFREIMDQRKILLVNLSKGRLGDINSYLLGLIITGKLLMAAFSRVDMPEEERHDFYLYIDEFQNFTTDSISTILSEARKYKLCLNIAHQYIAQLPDDIKGAVFGNVGSMVSFRIGADDAEFLVKQFEPVFDQNDLINIDNFNAYIKLLVNNQTSRPFNITAYPPQPGNPQITQLIKELSALKYGRDRRQVDLEIQSRYRMSLPVGGEAFIDSSVK